MGEGQHRPKAVPVRLAVRAAGPFPLQGAGQCLQVVAPGIVGRAVTQITQGEAKEQQHKKGAPGVEQIMIEAIAV